MKKEGIKVLFGGSFNPPTIAHYAIAKAVIEAFKVRDFVFLPTGNVYHKPELIEGNKRLAMTDITASKFPCARSSDYELKQKKYRGTAKTLRHFRGYYFLLGADNFITMPDWIDFPAVVRRHRFIVLERWDIDCEAFMTAQPEMNACRRNFIFFQGFLKTDVSASRYRETKDESLLLPEIAEYIRRNNLYKKK